MAKINPQTIHDGAPIGRDVDLAQEDVRLKDGTRLTDEVVAEIVEQVRRGNGPSSSRPITAAVRKPARGGDGQR